MQLTKNNLDSRLVEAVTHFWKSRAKQAKRKGKRRDQGARGAVTGGKQLDGFAQLIRDVLLENGVPSDYIKLSTAGTRTELPGYFRPEKKWDVLVLAEGHLLALVELKSQVGSFGNNYNNRTEEAVGNAADIWTAYREKAFPVETRPWLGYLMILEDAEASNRPVDVSEPHFPVFPEFKGASYVGRYRETVLRLLRERLYDGGCLILTPGGAQGIHGVYKEPASELTFQRFVTGLVSAVTANLRNL